MDKVQYEEKLIANILDSIERHGGKECLSSIILTGSFGHGEPTYQNIQNDEFELKSDVEIALVYLNRNVKKATDELIRKVCLEFKEDLNLMPISYKRINKVYNFNGSLKTPKYKTLFTYDLFNGSRTIWGENIIGKHKVQLNSVDPYEAKRIVANRIGELIFLGQHNDDKFIEAQWNGKLMLALGSAWLLINGQYISSYHIQRQRISQNSDKVEVFFGEGFIEDYYATFSFLRKGGESYCTPKDKLRVYVKSADIRFKNKGLHKPKINSFSRNIKYIVKNYKSGAKFGYINFENLILQELISGYSRGNANLIETADIWYKILY